MACLTQRIDYSANGCYYSIDLSNNNRIQIQLEDRNIRKTSTVMITEPMLKDYKTTIDNLRNAIYLQSIHQGSKKKYLLSHDQDNLIITFTYPKCKLKSISFKCEWTGIDQSLIKVQRVAKQVQAMMQDMKEAFQKMFNHFSELADAKLAQIMKAMQGKYRSLSKDMDNGTQEKINEFYLRCQQIMQQNQRITNQVLSQQRQKLIDCNLRYFDQFKLIKTNLHTSIANCDRNIRELSHQVSDIRSFVLDHQQKIEDKVEKVAIDLSDFQRTVRFTFKQIKDQLASTQEFQPFHEPKNLTFKQIEHPSVSRIFIEIPIINYRKNEENKIYGEQTAYMPILSQKELKQAPNEEAIGLEDRI